MKQTIIKCDFCDVILHAANWWHDAEICNQCGGNIPIEMNGSTNTQNKPFSKKEELMDIFGTRSK